MAAKLPPPRPPKGAASTAPRPAEPVEAPAPPPAAPPSAPPVEPPAPQPVALRAQTHELLKALHLKLTEETAQLAGHGSGRVLRRLIDQVDELLAFEVEPKEPAKRARKSDVPPPEDVQA